MQQNTLPVTLFDVQRGKHLSSVIETKVISHPSYVHQCLAQCARTDQCKAVNIQTNVAENIRCELNTGLNDTNQITDDSAYDLYIGIRLPNFQLVNVWWFPNEFVNLNFIKEKFHIMMYKCIHKPIHHIKQLKYPEPLCQSSNHHIHKFANLPNWQSI